MKTSTIITIAILAAAGIGTVAFLKSQAAADERERQQLELQRQQLMQQQMLAMQNQQNQQQQQQQQQQGGATGLDLGVAIVGAIGSLGQGVIKLFD